MASFASRDGTAADAVAKVFTSSLPRADQRPCSTQNDAIGMRPDFEGRIRLTVSTRSCCPPLTMIAGLHEHLVVAEVLDLQLIHVAGLMDFDGLGVQRLGQGQRNFARCRFAVNEIDGEVFVHDRTGRSGIHSPATLKHPNP